MRALAIALLIALLGAMSPIASAQQLMPLVPDPIATPDLKPIIDTLGLSDQQALQLLPLHDAYKERYTQFLNTDVRELTDQLVEIGLRFTRGRFEIPERRELERVIEDFKRLLAKSQSLDRAFFTEIGGILSDEQMPKLDRARINRELKVYREILGGVGEMNRGAGVNIAEMVGNLDLNPAELEQVHPILTEYESALLAKSHTVFNVLADAAKVVLDLIDSLNIRNKTLEEMAMMGQNPDPALLDTLRNTFDTASKPIQEAAWDVSQLNMRTYRRITPVVRPEIARDLKDRYYRRAFREVYPNEAQWLDRYRAALRLEGLTEEQKQTIESQRDSYLSQDDAALDAGANLLEDSRKYKTFKQFSREEPDPTEEKIDELVERRATIAKSATSTLDSLLGETLVAQLDDNLKSAGGVGARRGGRRVVAAAGPGGAEINVEVTEGEEVVLPPECAGRDATTPVSADPYLPQPVGSSHFERVLIGVGVSEDNHAVAMSLFDTYRVNFDQLRSTPLAVEKAGEEATAVETAKARATRTDELASLDKQLFDDLSLLLDDEHKAAMQGFRATRVRAVSTEIAQSMGRFFGDEEAFIDLVGLMSSADIPPEVGAQARAALGEYDARATPILGERLAAAQDVLRRGEVMRRAGQRSGGGGPFGSGSNQAMEMATEKWREARKKLSAINDKIVAVNREMLAQLIEALSTDAAWHVRLAYNSAAYPEIFRDERSAEKALQGALALPDLAEHQRESINELAAKYLDDFFAICDQMVALRRERDFDMFGGQMPKKEDIDREIVLEKMRFDRNELSARARMRLTMVLTDEQAKVIVPEPQRGRWQRD